MLAIKVCWRCLFFNQRILNEIFCAAAIYSEWPIKQRTQADKLPQIISFLWVCSSNDVRAYKREHILFMMEVRWWREEKKPNLSTKLFVCFCFTVLAISFSFNQFNILTKPLARERTEEKKI